mmetsp:Transcript_52727/g.141209  ORF Transcript_52727/g.141209 Transcript_52727/m.141209 type:complete len:354 (+) Transcript_52727:286-1347(+)
MTSFQLSMTTPGGAPPPPSPPTLGGGGTRVGAPFSPILGAGWKDLEAGGALEDHESVHCSSLPSPTESKAVASSSCWPPPAAMPMACALVIATPLGVLLAGTSFGTHLPPTAGFGVATRGAGSRGVPGGMPNGSCCPSGEAAEALLRSQDADLLITAEALLISLGPARPASAASLLASKGADLLISILSRPAALLISSTEALAMPAPGPLPASAPLPVSAPGPLPIALPATWLASIPAVVPLPEAMMKPLPTSTPLPIPTPGALPAALPSSMACLGITSNLVVMGLLPCLLTPPCGTGRSGCWGSCAAMAACCFCASTPAPDSTDFATVCFIITCCCKACEMTCCCSTWCCKT